VWRIERNHIITDVKNKLLNSEEKKMKRFLLITLLSWWLFHGCDSSNENIVNENEKIPVEVEIIHRGNLEQTLEYNGDIMAEYEVKVFSKIADRIERFFVDEGDYVKKGMRLAKIYSATIEQNLRQAEAALTAAKAQEANLKMEFERVKRLYNENAMSKQQYDAISTQYEAAQAQVIQAEATLSSAKNYLADATITAPISGIIGKRYQEDGDMANPALPLLSIVQMNRVKIIFNSTEEDLGRLQTGQEARVRVRTFSDQIFRGSLNKISPVLDPLTRMAEVEVILDNPGLLLKPGMYAEVEVVTGLLKDVILIPRYVSIESTTLEKVEGQDQVVKNYFVFTVENNTSMQKKLDVLYINHRAIAVNSGVNIGDTLVVTGQNNLRDGLQVKIVNKEDVEL
jgi:RND family efflux transporter MFP subunit